MRVEPAERNDLERADGDATPRVGIPWQPYLVPLVGIILVALTLVVSVKVAATIPDSPDCARSTDCPLPGNPTDARPREDH